MDIKCRTLESDIQEIKLTARDISGFVLDVGGGGEGIIGKLYGAQTVSIDINENELRELSGDSLKIVMDACSLKFLERSFEMAAFFYSLMYMDLDSKKAALREAFRVIKQGVIIEIWDTELPQIPENKKDIFIANVAADILGEKIITGYGVYYPDKYQTLESTVSMLNDVGFSSVEYDKKGIAFHITAIKKL